MKLAGKVALITGGSEGIGFGVAELLASEGAHVAIVSRNSVKLDKALESLKAVSEQPVLALPADVAKADEVQATVDQVLSVHGKIDILVNGAGIITKELRSVQDVDVQEWERVMATNTTGTLLFSRAVLPGMQAQNHGYIINILSTGAFRSLPQNCVYAASKYGARAITEALIAENHGTGVRISSVSPGPVETAVWDYRKEKATPEDRAKMLLPADIAQIVLFLVTLPERVHIDNLTVRPWYLFN